MQKNLQLFYSAILNVDLHCSSIVKPKILFYSLNCLPDSPLSQACLPLSSLLTRFELSHPISLLPSLPTPSFSSSPWIMAPSRFVGASSPTWVMGRGSWVMALSSPVWVVGCGSLKSNVGLMSLWVSQVRLRWLDFESIDF